MSFIQLYGSYLGYGAVAAVAAYRYFANSYVPPNAVASWKGDVVEPGFYPRAPFSESMFVIPRNFTPIERVDVMISWPGNGNRPLRVMMNDIPLRVHDSPDSSVSALCTVGIRRDRFTTLNARFDPSSVRRNMHLHGQRKYFGAWMFTTDYFVARWEHLCQSAALAASARLTKMDAAPHVDVAIDVLIEELDTVLRSHCGLQIDGHIDKVSWEDV